MWCHRCVRGPTMEREHCWLSASDHPTYPPKPCSRHAESGEWLTTMSRDVSAGSFLPKMGPFLKEDESKRLGLPQNCAATELLLHDPAFLLVFRGTSPLSASSALCSTQVLLLTKPWHWVSPWRLPLRGPETTLSLSFSISISMSPSLQLIGL